jgi:hypothetical protein
VVTDHHMGPRSSGGDLVDIERRCVSGQDGFGLCDLIDFGEHLLLERHALEDGFGDDVGLFETVIGKLWPDQRHALIHHGLREAALLHRARVVFANGREAPVEGFLCRLFQNYGNAGVGVVHRDAAAHRAGADHRGFANVPNRRVFGQPGNLGNFTLAEEGVDHGFRLIGEQALFKERGFLFPPGFEGELGGCFDSVDR